MNCWQKIKGRPEPAFSINLNTDYGFLGAIASLAALATRNFTTVLALIWMGSPVCGFASDARLAVRFHQPAEAGHNEHAVLLGLFHSDVGQSCSRNPANSLVGKFSFLGQMADELSLGLNLMPCFLLGKEWIWIFLRACLTTSACGKHPYFTRVPHRLHAEMGIITWLFTGSRPEMAQT